jgi:hypothetical protein
LSLLNWPPRQAGDEAGADRVASRGENNGDDRRRLLSSQDHASARRNNNINLALDEFGRDLGGALGATLRPAILDRDSTTLDPAEFAQPLYKSGGPLALPKAWSRPKTRQSAASPTAVRALRAATAPPRCRLA